MNPHLTRIATAMTLAAALTSLHALAAPAGDAAQATTDFFARMSAKDLPGVSRYLPAGGFSEFLPDSKDLLQLDAKAFEGLFNSGKQVDLRVADVKVQAFGDISVVTGTRLGGIAAPGTAVPQGRQAFTMVWQREGEAWVLRHIHLSAQP